MRSSEYGSQNQPVLTESERDEMPSILRADISQNINGRRVERHFGRTTIDGYRFQGSFDEAMKAAAAMPIRWAGMFD